MGHVEEAHGEMELDISGWHGVDRQEKKDKKRRASQRKADSREEQQQVEMSIGGEAVPDEHCMELDGRFFTAYEFFSQRLAL